MVSRMARSSAAALLFVSALAMTPATPARADDTEGWATRGSYHYNTDYLFSLTRELVRNSPHSPGVSAVAAPVTIAADIALLPFSLVLGLMG